jgi:uncharacterized protein YqgC (DUF456 family)
VVTLPTCTGGIFTSLAETTRAFRTPPLPVVWAAIVASLVLAYVIDPAWLLAWPFWPRLIVACVIGFLPVYLANVAFAKRFAATDHAQSAFAINPLGAILGGCLEYGALITGSRNLLNIVGCSTCSRSYRPRNAAGRSSASDPA